MFLLMFSDVPAMFVVLQGIPTLLMAAGSFDDILAITGFSTCLGIAFSKGVCRRTCSIVLLCSALHAVCPSGSTWINILKGLLEVVGGVIAGLVLGLFLCCFPSKDQVRHWCDAASAFKRSKCETGELSIFCRRTWC